MSRSRTIFVARRLMAELARTTSVSRSAWLELHEELQLVNDGYEFLDEKRILLAAEMLRQRDTYRQARADFMVLGDNASVALREAAAAMGLDGLQVHPVTQMDDGQVRVVPRAAIGQIMLQASFVVGDAEPSRRSLHSPPELRDCKRCFEDLLSAGAALAALATNLKRLTFEYRRTERRVRALENVVLPEIRDDLAIMEEHLDLMEQEEVIRVRSSSGERPITRSAFAGDR